MNIMRRLHFMTLRFFHQAKLTRFQNKRYTIWMYNTYDLYSYMNCYFVLKMLIFNPKYEGDIFAKLTITS